MTTLNWLSKAQAHFPSLTESNCQLTSPADEGYNCIAWAAEDSDRWWWPDAQEQNYWPSKVPRSVSVEAFEAAFRQLGYSEKSNSSYEANKQKVAIFVDPHGMPTHAARQLNNGQWTSKLGQQVDIAHELSALEGPAYGKIAVVLARSSRRSDLI
jgi:hypothetical protein